nr:transposase [Leucothrix pacifica]
MTSEKGKNCPIELRRIRFIRAEDKKEIVLISNDLKSEATVIMGLYKQRWLIELFFKWIKQNLRVKRYLGTSENAVLIKVLVTMIAYFLLRLIKSNYPVNTLSLQAIARLISANIFHRKSISELIGIALSKPKPDKTIINQKLEIQYT